MKIRKSCVSDPCSFFSHNSFVSKIYVSTDYYKVARGKAILYRKACTVLKFNSYIFPYCKRVLTNKDYIFSLADHKSFFRNNKAIRDRLFDNNFNIHSIDKTSVVPEFSLYLNHAVFIDKRVDLGNFAAYYSTVAYEGE